MSIMGFGLLSIQYTINNNLTTNQISDFIKVLIKASETYEYKDNRKFWHTIKLNVGLEGSYIGTYDIAKSGIPFISYKTILEALIEKANLILLNDKKMLNKYRGYKFDVFGTWEDGKIIMTSKQ